MKADLVLLDAARIERRQHAPRVPRREVTGRSEKLNALLVGASLAMIAGGVVTAALWFVWMLAEILP